MTWVRLDDTWAESEPVLQVGPLAAWLHVCALSYSNRNLTDGRIRAALIPRLCDTAGEDPVALAEQLVAAGMWKPTEDGYELQDQADRQPKKVDVERARKLKTARQADWRARVRDRSQGAGDAPVDASTTASGDAPVDRAPNPTRPAPKEGGSGRSASHVDPAVVASTRPSTSLCPHGRRRVRAADGTSCPDCDAHEARAS